MSIVSAGRATKRQPVARYGTATQALHWLTAILVVITFVYGPGGSEERVYAASRDFDRRLHESLGLGVLALVALRILWRLVDTRPAPPQLPRWMHIMANAVQATLYVLLFAVPLTAIAGAWLEGHALTLLGDVRILPLLNESHATGAWIARVHGWLGDAIVWVAGVHALASLFHHFLLKDGVLQSMLPRWASRER